MGLATSTPPVVHEPGVGSYFGQGFLRHGLTARTPVIRRLLFSFLKPSGGGALGSGDCCRPHAGRDRYGGRRADEISSIHGVLLKGMPSQAYSAIRYAIKSARA